MLVPLIFFGLSIFTIIIASYINIINNKIQQTTLIISIFNALLFALYIPLLIFEIITDQSWFDLLFIIHSSLSILLLIVLIFVTLLKLLFLNQYQKIFLNSIVNTKKNIYYVVDKKERIKQMSEGLLEELGFSFKDVKGKKIFDIFNRAIRITHFDNIETNNRSLEIFYETYQKEVLKEQVDNRTMIFQNHDGKSVLTRTTEQPLYVLGKYFGRINIGEKQRDFNLLEVEQKLNKASQDFESLRLKYIATIEVTNQGLYYIDLDDRSIWASQILVEKLKLSSNTINFDDFQKYIFKDDLNSYLGTLSNLTVRKDNFKTKYRFLVDSQYVWLTDKGKRIFEDKQSNLIIGTIDIIDASGYTKTGLEVLDNLKTEKYLIPHLNRLLTQNKSFELGLFHLYNLPEINKEFGRDVGNMLISEYVKKLIGSFMSESSDIFRIAGTTFAVTIVDPRKSSILNTGIKKNKDFLNLKMTYGVIEPEIEVKLGIAEAIKDAQTGEDLLNKAEQALNLTKHKNYQGNVCYYGELDD